jgi:prepilin-type N-terminal cleavage/methylation domain-containing protein
MLKLFARKSKGFTLIELLVVISIIGILSSIVLVSMGGARAKARDARRQSDMRQIGSACELYMTDNEAYPAYAAYSNATATGAGIGTYMPSSAMPEDPGSGIYTWISNTGAGNAQKFCVYAQNDATGTYYAASHKGARMDLGTAPTTTDCWY